MEVGGFLIMQFTDWKTLRTRQMVVPLFNEDFDNVYEDLKRHASESLSRKPGPGRGAVTATG